MVTMTRDNALLAAFLIEKGQMVPEGWKALQEALDMPVGSPRAQIKSVLEQYLHETDTIVDTTPASVNIKYYTEASGLTYETDPPEEDFDAESED